MQKKLIDKLLLPALTVGAFLLYAIILKSGLPEEFTALFRQNSSLLFMVVLGLYFLVFRLPKKWSWGLGLSFTLVLFAFPLLYLWSSAYSDNGIIGGLLPYKDGKYYYWGAQMILRGDLISNNGVQAAGRPLFPGFLSVIYFFLGGNLKWGLALISGLAGLAAFLSAFYFSEQLGSLVAAFYMTLLYFYIQPLLGFTMSELAGFIFGCLGCVLMWKAAKDLSVRALMIGLLVTMFAVSIRTGAFFVFPMLILWAGWVFRGEQKFSLRIALFAFITVAIAFLVLNVIYPKFVVEPGAMTNGNFAYALYGQVRGGVGWNEAIKATGTRDPNVVYQAAWDFFLRHPFSFPLGILKSYRDFFAPGSRGIFSFSSTISGVVLQILCLLLIIVGLFQVPRRRSDKAFIMVLASFTGILLSIPFLPPIDGGSRFYASTMSFFFLFVAFPLSDLPIKVGQENQTQSVGVIRSVQILSFVGILLTIFFPILTQRFYQVSLATAPQCSWDQVPFIARIAPGSYINITPASDSGCDLIPEVCLSDFAKNGKDATTDDFYQELVAQASAVDSVTRVLIYNNFIDEKVHYLLGSSNQLQPISSNEYVIGCAVEIETEHQSIYKVETVFYP